MSEHNPLHAQQAGADASFIAYGEGDGAVEVVESFGEYEAEYAVLRKGAGIFHMPQRGLIEVIGDDRADFLQRMISNDVAKLTPGDGCRAFLLNRQGRIIADLVVLQDDKCTLLDTDVFQATTVPAELDKYLFAEDVKLADVSAAHTHIALLGPAAAKLCERAGLGDVSGLKPFGHRALAGDGPAVHAYRRDEVGALGIHLLVPADRGAEVYQRLAEVVGGLVPEVEGGVRREVTGRGVGWLAYNTARIEAATGIYHIDFGPDSLPHETGALDQAVSFTKGCYLGQEIVARMQSLGHPKRVLVPLRCAGDAMPLAGEHVFDATDRSTIIGAVTSSTVSPLLGGRAIALAMIKWGKHRPDTTVIVPAEGSMTEATVQAGNFLQA